MSCNYLKVIRALRQKCNALNSAHSVVNKGNKLFFVISEKIMSRNANGKFEAYIGATQIVSPRVKQTPDSSQPPKQQFGQLSNAALLESKQQPCINCSPSNKQQLCTSNPSLSKEQLSPQPLSHPQISLTRLKILDQSIYVSGGSHGAPR